MKQKKITDQCQVCNSHNIHKMNNYYDKHGLMSCSNCGFVFMEKIPTQLLTFWSDNEGCDLILTKQSL